MFPSFNRHVIVFPVPEPFASRLEAMRKQYDTFTRQWLPPHITVIPPFEHFITQQEIDAIRVLRVDVVATFAGWGSFQRSRTSVLFLKLDEHTVDAAREQLLQSAPTFRSFADGNSHSHVTVVSRIPNEQFEDVAKVVTAETVEGTFAVDRFMLYRWDDELRRWIALTMPLT